MSEIQVEHLNDNLDLTDVPMMSLSVEDHEPVEIIIQEAGTTGPQGEQGIQGLQGVQGVKGDPGGWVTASGIVGTTSLDTIVTPGLYFRGAAADASVSASEPYSGWSGPLEVIQYYSSNFIVQRAHRQITGPMLTAPMTYQRSCVSGTWSPWRALTHHGELGGGAFTGTGSPEAVVTAPVGMKYVDTAATNGAIEWVKHSGTGNTGWKVALGDTGMRKFVEWNSSGVYTQGEGLLSTDYAPQNGMSGGIYLRRINNEVEVHFEAIKATVQGPGSLLPGLLPVGFRPHRSIRVLGDRFPNTVTAAPLAFEIYNSGLVSRGGNVSWSVDNYFVRMIAKYSARDTNAEVWPTSLPGVAV